jgi:hypothetical protein
MLWIGWTSFVLGLIMVLGARALRRRPATAFWLCTGSAAVFLVCTAILAPVQPGFYSGLPIYGGYLLLAALARAEMTRAANGSSALYSISRAALCIPRFFSILARFPIPQLWRYGATVSTRPFQGACLPLKHSTYKKIKDLC